MQPASSSLLLSTMGCDHQPCAKERTGHFQSARESHPGCQASLATSLLVWLCSCVPGADSSASLRKLRHLGTHVTVATPSPGMKRERSSEPLEPALQLADLMSSSGSDSIDSSIVGWPLSPPPRLLTADPGSISASTSSSSSPLEVTTSDTTTATTSAVHSSLSTKRPGWSRRLVITKQPASEFYKDEGGKANALEVEVTLVEFNEHGEPARSQDDEFVALPLRILLFFESGKRVDDVDQDIFRFVGNDYDSVVIRAPTRKTSVQFRLEKVSRRKDGQRFKLRIEVDQEQCTANVADLTPIFTNAICVLSKRKHHHSFASGATTRAKESAPKLIRRDLTRLEDKLNKKMDGLLAEMQRMSQQIQKQNELLTKHAVAPQPLHCTPTDTTSSLALEWFLKTSTADDSSTALRPDTSPQLFLNTAMPYFEVADAPYNDVSMTRGSTLLPCAPVPSRSDGEGVELPSATLPFGDI